MQDQPGAWLLAQPHGRSVLAAYAAREAALPAAARLAPLLPPETAEDQSLAARDHDAHEQWVPRLTDVEAVPREALPALHGKLIALGLLRFELFGRAHGMRYRLSPEGRSLLGRLERGELVEAADDDGDSAASGDAASAA